MDISWTEPTAENVKRVCAEFDSWDDNPDPALTLLFHLYPENTRFEHVFLKVVALNSTYSTLIRAVSSRTPTIYDIARHIVNLKIDDALRTGDISIVAQIANVNVAGEIDGAIVHKKQFNYSFATKYCNWHRPECYPIYDSRVDAYLWTLHKQQTSGFRIFRHQELYDYASFHKVVTDFRKCFGLEGFSFKEIDKFLYVEGGKLMNAQQESKTGNTD